MQNIHAHINNNPQTHTYTCKSKNMDGIEDALNCLTAEKVDLTVGVLS